jgi:hypothetical protein
MHELGTPKFIQPYAMLRVTMSDYSQESWVELYRHALLELKHSLMAGRSRWHCSCHILSVQDAALKLFPPWNRLLNNLNIEFDLHLVLDLYGPTADRYRCNSEVGLL